MMNKSEIIEVANNYNDHDHKDIKLALQAAARLLEGVEVVEEGTRAQKGDVLYKKWTSKYGYSENVFFAGTEADLPEFIIDKDTQIIQRNGKPVIIDKEGK